MAIYSIKDLEKLSGIKAHTIRIWEQRYGIITPKRTNTNIRYYQDADLKHLLNIALLNKNGTKISIIAKMDKSEIAQKVATISEVNFKHDTQIDALTIAMIEMDEYKFDRIISTYIQQLGFERTVLEIIYPFLEKLGLLWLTGSINPVHEKFMSYLIRQKAIVAINNVAFSLGQNIKKFLIYLPEGETQELSLLLLHYLLKSRGNQVIYLGLNVSLEDIEDAYLICKADYIYTMITESYTNKPVQQYVDSLSNMFPDATILLSGYQVMAQKVKSINNIKVLGSLGDTVNYLDELNLRKKNR